MDVADHASGLLATGWDADTGPGGRVSQAFQLIELAERALAAAMICERERGSSWAEIAQYLGTGPAQAKECFAADMDGWNTAFDVPYRLLHLKAVWSWPSVRLNRYRRACMCRRAASMAGRRWSRYQERELYCRRQTQRLLVPPIRAARGWLHDRIAGASGSMGVVDSARASDSGLHQLMGLEVSAVSLVRDYVELHFDGPVLRALSNPSGVYGGVAWQFPAPGSLDLMRCYIGETVDGHEEDPERVLALHFGEHRFVIPLDDGSSLGPESAHVVGVDDSGRTSPRGGMWIW